MQARFCWRCKKEVPMLEPQEWERVSPLLSEATQQVKRYREAHGASIEEARCATNFGHEALGLYHEITGYKETNADALWHHQLNQFGPPCASCGKPLRTPHAKLCAECGAPRRA